MNRRAMPLIVGTGCAMLVTILTGCAVPQPTKTVTAAPSPAVTVTATAAPDPAAALSPLDAWSVCYAFLTRYASRSDPGFVIPQLRTYNPNWVTQKDDGFQVQISPADLPGDWSCTVSGSVGAPKILSWSTNN